MILYGINKRNRRDGHMEFFHENMFHGHAWRPSRLLYGCHAETPPESEQLNRTIKDMPLQVVREGTCIPDIFSPHGWIVSQEVKDRLDGVPNLTFGPVNFVRLFEYPWALGDLSYRDDPDYMIADKLGHQDEALFFFRKPHNWDLTIRLQPYYELQTVPWEQRESAYPDAKLVTLVPGGGRYSEKMLDEHPLIVSGSITMTEPIFERIQQFFNLDFYSYVKFETDFKTGFGDSLKVNIIERV